MPKSQPTEIQRLNWQRAAALRALQCADAQVDGTLRDYGTNVNEHHYRAIKDAISALCQFVCTDYTTKRNAEPSSRQSLQT